MSTDNVQKMLLSLDKAFNKIITKANPSKPDAGKIYNILSEAMNKIKQNPEQFHEKTGASINTEGDAIGYLVHHVQQSVKKSKYN